MLNCTELQASAIWEEVASNLPLQYWSFHMCALKLT